VVVVLLFYEMHQVMEPISGKYPYVQYTTLINKSNILINC
jgi:hypothetical protein